MKAFPCGFVVLIIAALNCLQVRATASDTNQPDGFRLTVELQDGSRIIGKSRDASFQFHSETLGDLDLPLGKIRMIESLPRTNQVELTTSTADSLAVAFAMKSIQLEAEFGDIKLPVAQIRSVRVSPLINAGRLTDGLIGSWSGENNGADSVGGNDGILQDVSYTDGVTGKAFTFSPNSFPYGTYVGIHIPDKATYILTNSLTIEGWIRPRGNGYVIFWRGDHRPGLDPYALSTQANHDLRFQICDENNHGASVDATIPYYTWTHVAATLDGDAGTISLYTNGVLAAQNVTTVRPFGALDDDESPGVGIGNVNDGGNNFPFAGDIDEISLYDRALSADEINAIYNENSGKADGRAGPLPSQNQNIMSRHFGPAAINFNSE